jgi:hypothetical protein
VSHKLYNCTTGVTYETLVSHHNLLKLLGK